MKPERIQILHFFDSFQIGGAERQFLNLIAGLDEREFEIHVACFRAVGELQGEIHEERLPLREYRMRSLRSPLALARLVSLVRFLIRQRISILHTTNVYPNLFGVVAGWLARTPVIIASVRDMGQVWSSGLRQAQRSVCRLADAVVTNAEAIAERLRREGYDAERIQVIRNGVLGSLSPRHSHPAFRQEFGLAPDVPVVAAVCRLHWVKRLEDFLDAAAIVAASHPRVRFAIVGPLNGAPEPKAIADALRSQAARLGLTERLIFTDSRNDVSRLLSEVAVSVLPSLTEGLSNTLLESMAAGVPVVATAVGGNPEIIEDGVNGLLVPAAAPAALAAAIGRLLDSPALAARLGSAGQQRIQRDFGCERMVEETRQLYLRLLANARDRGRLPAGLWSHVP